jgi:hypothetical protein
LQQVLDNVSFTFVLTARLLLEKAHEGVVLEAFGVAVMVLRWQCQGISSHPDIILEPQ